MKITLEKLGALRYGEFELGDMTIICGENNTGKTYATYALFGFLHTYHRFLKRLILNKPDYINKTDYEHMQEQHKGRIDLEKIIPAVPEMIKKASEQYTKQLANIFSSDEEFFRDSSFVCDVSDFDFKEHVLNKAFNSSKPHPDRGLSYRDTDAEKLFAVEKKSGSFPVTITFLKSLREGERRLLRHYMAEVIYEVFFANLFPLPFIASAERTGAAIFYREMGFARNILYSKQNSKTKETDPCMLSMEISQDYALPVKVNVDFTRNLEKISKKTSDIAKQYPHIPAMFSGLIGGSYDVKKDIGVQFRSAGKLTRLSMSESSSAVRSMLDIGFYLLHLAKPGHILMIDQPELNLHPENQRKMARLLACLVNAGVRVFVTTHSDYFIKEINTLILLNQDKPYLKKIREEEKYPDEALISADKVKVYEAEKAKVLIPENKRKTTCQTLTKAPVESYSGIEVKSFDKTINEMNRIEDRIIWDGK